MYHTVQKYAISIFMTILMMASIFYFLPANVAAANLENKTTSMKITKDNLSANSYETYYYSDGIRYTYEGDEVTFLSDSQIEAGGKTYDLKNKKSDISIESAEDGTISISLSNLSVPVGSISGAWNSSFGGVIQGVYSTDIPGMEEIRSDNSYSLNKPFTLENVPSGTWHLFNGTIYEKANEWSPGYDFGNGTVTEANFGVLPDITITVSSGEEEVYIGEKTEAKVYDDFENDIWLQYQQKEMKVGDTAALRPWRVPQIVSDTINNDVDRPNFHFEVISGDSVTIETNKNGDKDDSAVVKAVKEGTSIVKVTYDEEEYKGSTWGAISPVNTAYAVYTVGEIGKAVITTNDSFANWRHYDTIYYKEGNTTPYAFTVNTTDAVSVKVTVNGEIINGNDGNYIAQLENRSNIIGIEATDVDGNVKSLYRVIDARFIEIEAVNKTNPDKALAAGDTANISLKGITMPVYKLATIYNPCFGSNVTRIEYSNDTLGDFTGKCSQWDLATNNDFDVTFEEAGEYTFTSEKGIHCAWWGSTLGADIIANGSGEPNLNAPVLEDYFSVLPDFTLTVEESVPVESVTLDKNNIEIQKGDTYQLTAEVLPGDATHPQVSWTSSNEEIATVKDGLVTGLKAGTVNITAEADKVKAVCTVKVIGSTLEEVNQAIAALPDVDKVTSEDRESIEKARELYDNLAEEDKEKVIDYSRLVNAEAKITALDYELTIAPETVYPGAEVTINFGKLVVPDTGDETVREMYTSYTTNIPGVENVNSLSAVDDEEQIKTLTFTVPENTAPGTYYLTNGYVYKEWGGTYIQGVFLVGTETKKFYEGEMPEITIEVKDYDKDMADKVIVQINQLGQSIDLSKEADVKAAREAYEKLSEEQKALIPEDILNILQSAEKKIEELKATEQNKPQQGNSKGNGSKPTVNVPKAGTIVQDTKSAAYYCIIKSGVNGGTVQYVKPMGTKVTAAVIPSSINVLGTSYKVTSIASGAFNNQKKLKKVSIGNNITSIGTKAFYKCTGLKKVTIPASVQKIGAKAFFGCKNLKNIKILTSKLTKKSVGSKAFKGIYKKAVVKVPKKNLKLYSKWMKTRGGKNIKVTK